jgi:DNA-binding CsgD family transcriptional regulator
MNVMTDNRAAEPALCAAVPRDVETLLRCLADRFEFENSSDLVGRESKDRVGNGQILLDVEIGDIRFLALKVQRPSPISLLSPRELEVARMVAAGYPNKTIASILEISSWTVASHLRRIFIKLEVSSRAAMAAQLSAQAHSNLATPGIDHAHNGVDDHR